MSEAGLPGAGVKLGPELFHGPKGIWYTGVSADGADVGVLRFDPEALAGDGALAALIDRVVAARAGRLSGALTVVDLIEGDGQVWLITAETPVPETADRMVELLLAAPEAGTEAEAEVGADVGADIGAAGPAAVAEAEAEAGADADAPADAAGVGPLAAPAADPALVPDPAPVELPIGSRIGLAIRIVVGLALVGGIIGVAAVIAGKVNSKQNSMPLKIAGISVESPGGFSSANICTASLPMRAVLQTNGGSGVVDFEWDLPNVAPVKASKRVSGNSPQELSLTWDLRLHGKGTVTAKFVVDNAGVLAPGAVATASTSLTYQCPGATTPSPSGTPTSPAGTPTKS